MNNKIMIWVLILSFILSVPAYAKDKRQQTEKPLTADDIVAKMQIQLQLTDKQVGQVKPIIVDFMDQERQLKLREKKELSKVLTGDQLFTWNFLQNEPPREKKHSKL